MGGQGGRERVGQGNGTRAADLNMASSMVPGLLRSVAREVVYGVPPTFSSTSLSEQAWA